MWNKLQVLGTFGNPPLMSIILTPLPQGRARPFTIKCTDIWHGNRSLSDVIVTVDLGMLSSGEFGDMKSQSLWVSHLRRET